LGCNNFGMRMDSQADVDAVVGAALDAGINYFDTAEMYGGGGASEKMLGKALEGRRDEALVATKWGHARGRDEGTPGADRATIRACCEASLGRLGVEVIDHYQLHTPDPMTPIAETLGALQELIDEGKIKAIGCSNFSADQLDEMAAVAKADGVTPFQTVQNRYSILTRSPETDGVLEACTRNNVGFVPYFPLESGLLTGKVRKGQDAPEGTRLASDIGRMFLAGDMLDRAESLISYAEGQNQTILKLAFSWLLAQANVVSVIAGATKPEQIAGNAGAAGWAMASADLAVIDELVPAG